MRISETRFPSGTCFLCSLMVGQCLASRNCAMFTFQCGRFWEWMISNRNGQDLYHASYHTSKKVWKRFLQLVHWRSIYSGNGCTPCCMDPTDCGWIIFVLLDTANLWLPHSLFQSHKTVIICSSVSRCEIRSPRQLDLRCSARHTLSVTIPKLWRHVLDLLSHNGKLFWGNSPSNQ